MRGLLLSNSFYFGSGQSRFRVELCIILPETKYFAKIQFLLTNNCDPCASTVRAQARHEGACKPRFHLSHWGL